MSKILFISHCAPPAPFGPSTLFRRLFKYFSPDSYVVMTSKYGPGETDNNGRLPCKYYYAGESIFRNYTRWSSVREWLDVVGMVARGLSVIKKEKITALLTHPTSGNFLLASYILHRLTGLPLYVYILDLYTASQTYRIRKLMSAPIEKAVMKASKKVFVMSETLKDHYDGKYNIDTALLRHPVELPSDNPAPVLKNAEKKIHKKKTVVFTGMIYEAQMDALRNLAAAVKGMQGVELHIYSQRTTAKLLSLGLSGADVVHHGFVEASKMPGVQREADVLFLPMAFESPYPEIIRTASPGKLPEYLISRTPVLVHAPQDAYIAWYARKYGWGFVVDKPDPGLLREALSGIMRDGALRDRLIENALNTARLHEASKVADALKKGLGLI
ncbi:MAG: hypothetical protein HZA14_04560 [Nitrospirae bacterium]|nr:hypothetical protein [Nitrospirota bacterium]